VTFSSFSAYEYHVDYIYTATNLLMIFLPVANRLSVDASIHHRRTGQLRPQTVSRLYRDAVLFCCVGLVYFDSVLYKLGSTMWWKGLGVWLPASYPHATWLPDLSWILDNHALVVFLSVLTLVFEFAFIFLMWSRRFHLLLLGIGTLLHVGIILVFPIPWFGLAMLSYYLLLLPDGCIGRVLPARKPVVDPCDEDYSTRLAVITICIVSLAAQAPSLINTPAVALASHATGTEAVWESVSRPLRPYTRCGRAFLGTTPHTMFLDFHFMGYDHELSVVHASENNKDTWLPLINKHGNTLHYNTGRMWVYWTFRVCGPQLNAARIRRGVVRLSAYWAHENQIPLDGCEFKIFAREYDRPQNWERGFAKRQSLKPWTAVGRLTWTNNRPSFEFENPDELLTSMTDKHEQ
jgi:hypothetical protein